MKSFRFTGPTAHLRGRAQGLPLARRVFFVLCRLKQSAHCMEAVEGVGGVLQARVLEWVGRSLRQGSSRPKDRTQGFRIAGGFLTSEPPGKLQLKGYASRNRSFWSSRILLGRLQASEIFGSRFFLFASQKMRVSIY